jgi:hypothetical protein
MLFRKYAVAVCVLCLYGTGMFAQKNTRGIPKSDLVEPRVDAANSRFFYFSSASRPFGMVNLSPDMELDGVWNTGYRYNIDTIK